MEVSAIQAWWAETTRLLDVHAQSAIIVLLGGDMNAAVGSIPTEEIGSQDADLQDVFGDFFAELLKAHQMWLPCTFPACHSGPSGTYVQKRNGACSRIDFIACPKTWRAGHVATWTDPAIHAGQAYVDHIATCAHIDMSLNTSGGTRHVRRRRLDGKAMLTPEGRACKIEAILHHAPSVPWAASPHAHAATIVRYPLPCRGFSGLARGGCEPPPADVGLFLVQRGSTGWSGARPPACPNILAPQSGVQTVVPSI
eukprot:s2691_g5.t1